MKYVLVDDITTRSALLETQEFDTAEEAIEAGEAEWCHLSEHDKRIRDAFFVLESVNPDEEAEDHLDGNPIKEWKYY